MTRQELLDLYYLDARARLIDIAAFLDRVERADGAGDFRLTAFRRALAHLQESGSERAQHILRSLSDPTTEPVPAASVKGACGAWPGTT
jgi:hypothetical protein